MCGESWYHQSPLSHHSQFSRLGIQCPTLTYVPNLVYWTLRGWCPVRAPIRKYDINLPYIMQLQANCMGLVLRTIDISEYLAMIVKERAKRGVISQTVKGNVLLE